MLFGFSVFVRNEMQSLPELLTLVEPYVEEIVVLDTGSTDGLWPYLRSLESEKFPKIRPYRLNIPFDAEHFNFGYTRSVAAHLNKCEYVLMLDADERMNSAEISILRDKVVPDMKKND